MTIFTKEMLYLLIVFICNAIAKILNFRDKLFLYYIQTSYSRKLHVSIFKLYN